MFSRSPIARKLMALIVIFSATITLVVTGLQLLFDYNRELDNLKRQMDKVATTQIDSLSHSVWTFDNQGINIIMNNILKIGDIEFMQVHIDEKHSWSGGSQTSINTIDKTIPLYYEHLGKQVEIGTLQIVASLDSLYERLLKRAAIILLSNGIKTFFVSLFILFLFQKLVTRHLIDLAEYATKVAAGTARGPFSLRRKKKEKEDELDNAVNAINLMRENLHNEVQQIATAKAERELLQEQLIQAQKMESVGRLAGGVAHDFNNMLSVILGHTELAIERKNNTELLHADLTEIKKAAVKSSNLTRQLLAFARNQPISPKNIDLNQVVVNVLKMLQRLIGEDIELIWKPGKTIWPIHMDPSQIDQILANLCINARDAISDSGRLLISTSTISFEKHYSFNDQEILPGDYTLLTINDNGCGMDRETLNHIFEPFFTTKSVGKGTGLGMATVYGIIKQNNSFISVYSEPGYGTSVKVYFPRYQGPEKTQSTKSYDSEELRGKETILLVEDDPGVLNVAKTMLEQLGYSVIPADAPKKAIELTEQHQGTIDLIISDVIMPDMNGRELCIILKKRRPEVRVLFISGYTADIIGHHGVLENDVHFIEKPFSRIELSKKIRETLEEEYQ